jgi:hypothetical protein
MMCLIADAKQSSAVTFEDDMGLMVGHQTVDDFNNYDG